MTEKSGKKLVLVAAAALFDEQSRILLAQRPPGKTMAGLWEFPGGKIEKNETPESALIRELSEELAVTVNKSQLIPLHFVSHNYPDFHLMMVLYACHEWEGSPAAVEGQNLQWVKPDDLHTYDAPAADIPLFEFISSGRYREPRT